MKTLSIDIETFSSCSLQKSGVYRYVEAPDFEILLFGYSVDAGPVKVIDLACGEKIPDDVLDALTDGIDADIHLYKVREKANDPLLQKLIGAYDADYPIAQREEAGTNAPTEV